MRELTRLLVAELPPLAREDCRCLLAAHQWVEDYLFRYVGASMMGAYQRCHHAPVAQLTERFHVLRFILPCDLRLPEPLWLLPPSERGAGGEGGASGEGDASAQCGRHEPVAVEGVRAPDESAPDDGCAQEGLLDGQLEEKTEDQRADQAEVSRVGESPWEACASFATPSPRHDSPLHPRVMPKHFLAASPQQTSMRAEDPAPLSIDASYFDAQFGSADLGAADGTANLGSADLAEGVKTSAAEALAECCHYVVPFLPLRHVGLSDVRLPYAEAVGLLRSLSYTSHATARIKVRVLVGACEAVVKSAQRALELHAATAASMGRPPTLGAEELLPLVAYVLVRSRTAILPAELAFVADFLPEGMANGQASLTHHISPYVTPQFSHSSPQFSCSISRAGRVRADNATERGASTPGAASRGARP